MIKRLACLYITAMAIAMQLSNIVFMMPIYEYHVVESHIRYQSGDESVERAVFRDGLLYDYEWKHPDGHVDGFEQQGLENLPVDEYKYYNS